MRLGVLAMMGRPPAAAGGLSGSFLQSASDTADATVYTFSAQNLGAAAADRVIVAVFAARQAGTATLGTPTVTIGGVSATVDAFAVNQFSNSACAGIAHAAVPSGTTGDVVVTYGQTQLRSAIMLYRITGGTVSVTSSDGWHAHSSQFVSGQLVLSTESGGYAVAGASVGPAATYSWSGVTEDADLTVESFAAFSSASTATSGASVVADPTTTPETGSNRASVAVAFEGA